METNIHHIIIIAQRMYELQYQKLYLRQLQMKDPLIQDWIRHLQPSFGT